MLKKVFYYLKTNTDFISINQLIQKTNFSKVDVLQSISTLKNMGYNIIENSNQEYLLLQDYEENFNQVEIDFYLKTNFIGRKLEFFDIIDSTNIFAKKFAEENNNDNIEGVSIVADNQTRGKGRLGRTWITQKNTNISLSLILSPKISTFDALKFNLIVSIAVCRAIKNFTNLKVNIKWPNDIIINGKKVGGILTETVTQQELKYIIIGIGINVNNDFLPEDLKEKATSLKIQTGKILNRSILLSNILLEIESIYCEYKKSLSFEPFIDEYKKLCLNIGKEVKVKLNNDIIYGKILDINTKGELILLTNSNKKIYLTSGEVSLRNLNGEYI